MYRVEVRFNVPDDHEVRFKVGSYVRKIGEDLGTGMVMAVSDGQIMDQKTNIVLRQIIYVVHWLDINPPDGKFAHCTDAELSHSARAVPTFDNPEAAQEWMEKQMGTGNWVDKAQDAADTSGDFDVEIRKLMEGG